MGFNPLNSVKSAALTGVQKGINQSLGTSGSFLGNAVNGLLGGISQSLFEVGNAFGTISSVTSLKLDSVVAGGETSFVSGKCPERAAAGDIEAGNAPRGVGQSMVDYKINTDPTGKIAKNSFHGNGKTGAWYRPLAWMSDKYYMRLRFFDYNRDHLFKKGTDVSIYSVDLPLPLELSDSQRAEYATADMKAVGTFMTEGIASGGLAAQVAMTAGPEIVGNIAGSIGGALAQKNRVFGAIGSTVSAGADAAGVNKENIVNAIEQYAGMAPNPQPSVLFKGPSLREFNFTWTFNPRDVDESKRIRETIERLKASALPRKAFTNSTGVMRYPHMCMINFYPWDGGATLAGNIYGWGEKSLIRIKRCFISNITSNYAPNGVPSFFEDTVGAPVFIQLSITLKEIEFFTSEDWGGVSGLTQEEAEKIAAESVKRGTGVVTEFGASGQ